MTITEVQQETGWGKRGDTWVPPKPAVHRHEQDDVPRYWDPGDIKWSARTTAAPGWLLCDGSLVSKASYQRLFDAIGFSYSPTPGTDPGGGNFYLPDTKGKVPVGRDAAQTEFDVLGRSGGSKTSTAAHTHTLSAHTHTYAHTHGMNSVDTNHAHNVYTRYQDTGGQSANHAHQAETEGIASDQGWPAAGHLAFRSTDRTGQLMYGGWGVKGVCQLGNNSVYQDHTHNFNHDHPSTNYQSEAPWAGTWNHAHTTNSQSASTSAGPSNDTSGASSVGATSGNLQPYVVFNCFVKT